VRLRRPGDRPDADAPAVRGGGCPPLFEWLSPLVITRAPGDHTVITPRPPLNHHESLVVSCDSRLPENAGGAEAPVASPGAWPRSSCRPGVPTGEKQIRGSGGSLEPPGPLPVHLHTVCMEYSECLPTLLNPFPWLRGPVSPRCRLAAAGGRLPGLRRAPQLARVAGPCALPARAAAGRGGHLFPFLAEGKGFSPEILQQAMEPTAILCMENP
jgi:hypothetical protein